MAQPSAPLDLIRPRIVALGAGSPFDVVQVTVVQKRGNPWVALRTGRWVKTHNRKAACTKAIKTTSALTGPQ